MGQNYILKRINLMESNSYEIFENEKQLARKQWNEFSSK